MRLTISAAGTRPAAVVWERYARLDLWPTWSPHIRRVEPAGRRLAAGLTGRVHGPLGVHADFVVDEVDPERLRWEWTVRSGPVRVHLEHGVGEAGTGSRTWLVQHGPAAVVLGYTPLARWALHRLVTLPPSAAEAADRR